MDLIKAKQRKTKENKITKHTKTLSGDFKDCKLFL